MSMLRVPLVFSLFFACFPIDPNDSTGTSNDTGTPSSSTSSGGLESDVGGSEGSTSTPAGTDSDSETASSDPTSTSTASTTTDTDASSTSATGEPCGVIPCPDGVCRLGACQMFDGQFVCAEGGEPLCKTCEPILCGDQPCIDAEGQPICAPSCAAGCSVDADCVLPTVLTCADGQCVDDEQNVVCSAQ